MKLSPPSLSLAAVLAATFFGSHPAAAAPRGFGVNANGQLFSFDLNRPTTVTPIGAAVNGNVRGIDFRPGTSVLHALEVNAQSSQLYTLSLASGARTPIGAGFPNSGSVGLANYSLGADQSYGFDFNPTTLQPDGSVRIRLVNTADADLRLNSDTGTVAAVDGSLAYESGNPSEATVAAAAYTNSNTARLPIDAPGTQLYYLETTNDNLVTIATNPNSGLFTTVGPLGADIDATAGFDILTANGQNKAYATVRVDGGDVGTLHLINLETGAASGSLGSFPAGFAPVNGFAIGDVPETPLPAGLRGYGYTANGQLVSFPLGNPAAVTAIGNPVGADVKALDFRPGTDALYALDVNVSTARLYLVNPRTGIRAAVGAGFPLSGTTPGTYELNPNGLYGFDFNPATLQGDGSVRIRLVTNQRDDLRLNSDTGAIAAVDGTLGYAGGTPATAGITAAAYTNSDTARTPGTGAPTRLFFIDTLNDNLVSVVPPADPNAGQFTVVGSLGVDVPNPVSFDIYTGPDGTNYGFIAVSGEGGTTLHRVDLITGQAGPALGTFPPNLAPTRGFAIGPVAREIPDSGAPVVRITNPRTQTRTVAQLRFRVAGVARDDVGVERVVVRIGSRVIRATGTTRWNRVVGLRPGRNLVRAIAFDAAGNRSVDTATLIRE